MTDCQMAKRYVAGIFCLLVVTSTLVAQQNRDTSLQRIDQLIADLLDSPMQQSDASDDQLTALRKERYNAALSDLNERYQGYQSGSFILDGVVESGRRFLNAELALAKDAADRAEILEKTIAVVKEFEDIVKRRVDAEVESEANLHLLRYTRLGLEIDLLQERGST